MDKLRFFDGYTIPIEDGASLETVTHIARDEAAAQDVCGHITPENVITLQFLHDDAVTGDYQGVKILAPATVTVSDDGVVVCMHFTEG